MRRRSYRRQHRTMLHGFGTTEEVIAETVEETAGPAPAGGLKMALAIGATGLIGLGLWYGITTKTYTGRRVWRGAV